VTNDEAVSIGLSVKTDDRNHDPEPLKPEPLNPEAQTLETYWFATWPLRNIR
jgi:hypothetical protein